MKLVLRALAANALLMTLGVSQASSEPARFNLHCEGTEKLTDGNVTTEHPGWSDDLRIDNIQETYCFGKCLNAYHIDLNGSNILYLEEDGGDDSASLDQEHMEFFRTKMELLWFTRHDRPSEHVWKSRFVKATCSYSPFTGIPN